jgi:hypothetical protein
MRVKFDTSALRTDRWKDYAARFVFGGSVTVAAGLVAKHYGPVIGGLFLAFPAIFPASVTLVAKDEQRKKQRAGRDGTARGKKAAALDARGAAIGAMGLACFAITTWKLLPGWNAFGVLTLAVCVWLIVSILIWRLEHLRRSASPRA